MTLDEFKNSLQEKNPPPELSLPLKALWYDGKQDWDKAHQIADKEASSNEGDWVHAYLHRKEGDEWNASYWYNRAGKQKPSVSLQEEWESIALALLG